MQKRVLVVDDDRVIRELTRDTLVGEGFAVSAASSGQEALDRMAREEAFDLVLTDLSMREMDGLRLLEEIKRGHPRSDVVILTAHASLETALEAMRLGAADYLRKPAKAAELIYCVNRTLLRRAILEENEALRGNLQAFEASRVLTSCMEGGDVVPMTLDILLGLLGRTRAVARLAHETPRLVDGVQVRGFSEPLAAELRQRMELGKLFELSELDEPSRGVSRGVREELERLGIRDEEPLALPLRQQGRAAGGIWLFPGRRPFRDEEVRQAELVVGQAQLALSNAERLVHAREKAFMDDVTDLYNARYLFLALDREVTRAERSNLALSVLFLDLDRFKQVNDQHGHLVGSRALHEFGQLLAGAVRSIDTVARYGGDEFTVVLVDTRLEGALQVAERIRTQVAAARFGGERGLSLEITVSIGVASYPRHGRDRESLIDKADKAMYLGKSLGRNHVCSADDLTELP